MKHSPDSQSISLINEKQSPLDLLKLLFSLSLPIILATSTQTVYQLTDLFWISKLSVAAITALSSLFSFIFLIFSIGMGMGAAASSLIGQYAGKNDKKMLGKVLGNVILIMLCTGLIFSLIALVVIHPFLNLLHLDDKVVHLALSYFYMFLPFLPLAFVGFCLKSGLRSIGEVKMLFYVSLLLMIINFFLDPVLIFGVPFLHIPALGLEGAALSNGFSIVISLLIFSSLFFKGIKGITIKLRESIPTKQFIISFLKFSLPSSFSSALRTSANVIMTAIIAIYLGGVALGVFGTFSRVLSMFVVISMGLSQSASILITHALGSDNKKQALRVGNMLLIIAVVLFSAIGVMVFVLSGYLVHLFSPKDAPVFAKDLHMLFQALAFFIPWIVCSYILYNIFMAAGDTKFVGMVSTFATIFAKLIPLIICVVVLKMGLLALALVYGFFYIVQTSIFLYYYLKKEWLDYGLLHRFKG